MFKCFSNMNPEPLSVNIGFAFLNEDFNIIIVKFRIRNSEVE